MERKTKAKMYKGMSAPIVELTEQDLAGVNGGAITVSLESIESDLHNQSFYTQLTSTGCMSAPGGPRC